MSSKGISRRKKLCWKYDILNGILDYLPVDKMPTPHPKILLNHTTTWHYTVSLSFSHQTRWGTWSIRWHSVVSTLSYSSGLHLYPLLLEQWLLHTWLIDSFNQWINVLSLANHSWKNSFGKTWFQKWEKTKNLLVGGEFGKIPIMITVLPKKKKLSIKWAKFTEFWPICYIC